MLKFIKTELKWDSDSDLDSGLERMETKFDNELEPSCDNDSVYDTVHWFFYLYGWLQIKMIFINNYK